MPPEAAVIDAPAAPAVPVAPDAPQSATVEAPFNDAFSDLDKMISDTPDEPQKTEDTTEKPEAKEKTPAKTDDKKAPVKEKAQADKVDAKNDLENGVAAASPAAKAKKTPWQLVHQYEGEISNLRKELETARGGSPKDHPEFKSLSERLEAASKRAEELENRMRFVNYKESQEFKDVYEKPYVDAWIAGRSRVGSMTMLDPESGETRRAGPEDFDALMKIPNDDDAAEFATQRFGNKAASVLYHRERVQELSGRADKAIEEYRVKGSEMEKQNRTQHEEFTKAVTNEVGKLWNEGIEGPSKKYPQWSQPVDGDNEGNQLLERGLALANKAFASFNVFDPKLTKEQRSEMVKLHTALFNKAAWFDRLALSDSRKAKRITELEKELQDYKASEPGTGSAKRGKAEAADVVNSWEKMLEDKAT